MRRRASVLGTVGMLVVAALSMGFATAEASADVVSVSVRYHHRPHYHHHRYHHRPYYNTHRHRHHYRPHVYRHHRPVYRRPYYSRPYYRTYVYRHCW